MNTGETRRRKGETAKSVMVAAATSRNASANNEIMVVAIAIENATETETETEIGIAIGIPIVDIDGEGWWPILDKSIDQERYFVSVCPNDVALLCIDITIPYRK